MKPHTLLQKRWRSIEIALLFEKRDLWLGVYWTRDQSGLSIYICIVPCFPFRFRSVAVEVES